MCVSEASMKIAEELEFVLMECRQIKVRGPHFRIVHRYNSQFSPCGPHEEIAAVYLLTGGQALQVRLGTTLSKLFDYMARHNRLAQTAKQIERGTRSNCLDGHRALAASRSAPRFGIPRRYIRVYMDRIRIALNIALHDAGVEIGADAVVVSEETATNETGYRLRGVFEWLHADPL